jgi:hypothetical protein
MVSLDSDAMDVIDKFDVVAIAPYFTETGCDMSSWFNLVGGGIANNSDVTLNANQKKLRKMSVGGAIKYIPGSYFDADQKLFAFARELSGRRKLIACCMAKALSLG